MATKKDIRRTKIKYRIRHKISGTTEAPRLTVFRSNKEIYAQVIDDVKGVTLTAASSLEKGVEKSGTKIEMAAKVGKLVAERAIAAGINTVVFDRNGYLYPASEQASSIVDVLIMELKHLQVEVLCNEEVKSIVQTTDTCYLVETIENQGKSNDIKSDVADNKDRKSIRKQYVAKKVIVATGGKASSKLGSDGSGYYFLEKCIKIK